MPQRNGTGPMGMGARSGRGLGMCTGVNAPALGQGTGRGFGGGFGMGGGIRRRGGSGFGSRGNGGGFSGGGYARRGWGFSPDANAAYPDTQNVLKEQAAYLESELKAVQQRLTVLKKESEK